MNALKRTTAYAVVVVLLLPLGSAYELQAASLGSSENVGTVIAWLRHQEQIIRSMYCEYRVRRLPTDDEVRPLIEAECQRLGRPEAAQRYMYSQKISDSQSYSARWWRDGPKERSEATSLATQTSGGAGPDRIVVFDGAVVRSLQPSAARQLKGVISSVRNAHWTQENRLQPFSLLYEYQDQRYSVLVDGAANLEIKTTELSGEETLEVSFNHPKYQWDQLVLWLSPEDGRLKRRHVISKVSDDEKPRLYESHEFSNYKEYSDGSGEPIFFPQRARYTYYMGTTPDGRHLAYTTEELEIEKAEFNLEMPDKLFALDFPPGTEVIDRLHDLGPITPAAPPTALQVKAKQSAWHVVLAVLAAATLALLVTWMRRGKLAEKPG